MRRQQVRAAALLAVPLLLASLLWTVALTATDRGASDVSAALNPGAEEVGDGPEASDGEGPSGRDTNAPTAADEAETGEASDADGKSATIEFDGVCEVEVEPKRRDDGLRPWHFAECERAPIAVPASGQRWIVVVASLSGADFAERQALARLDAEPAAEHLLWSSHYPSLNPDLWVLAAGPYATEAEAARAADRLGSAAYPRAISDDADDRYCSLADGCIGETRHAGHGRDS